VRSLNQTTSWEYIQFLQLANEGDDMLEAWANAGMSAPHEMASATIMIPEPSAVAMLSAKATILVGIRYARADRKRK
jgi:hypothetical protein